MHKKTREEIEKDLKDQLVLLESNCKNFDNGSYIHAKQIAGNINIILTDKGRNFKSLLGQLGIKDSVLYLSISREYNPENLEPYKGISGRLSINSKEATFLPSMSFDSLVLKNFQDYWENETILKDKYGNNFTRKELVEFVRDQDGSGHSDSKLKEKYHALKEGISSGWVKQNENGIEHVKGDLYSSIRGIGHEVLTTLKNKDIYKKKNEAEQKRNFLANYPCVCGSGREYQKCHGSVKMPQKIKDVCFSFLPDKLYKLDIAVDKMNINDLAWHFDMPFLSYNGVYNLKPIEVFNDPQKFHRDYKGIMESNLNQPIYVIRYKNKWLVLEGIERLLKAHIQGMKDVVVKIVPEEKISEITNQDA